MSDPVPSLRSVVLDTTDARGLAEFYRQLLGWSYRLPLGEDDDWVVLLAPGGGPRLAFQQVPSLPPSTWPGTDVPQQVHLDLTVPDSAALAVQRDRAVSLGAQVLADRSDDPEEPLYVFADPAGHPFCIFVA